MEVTPDQNELINLYIKNLRLAYLNSVIVPSFEICHGEKVMLLNEYTQQHRFFGKNNKDQRLFDYYPVSDRIFLKHENIFEHGGMSFILNNYLPNFDLSIVFRMQKQYKLKKWKTVLGISVDNPMVVNFYQYTGVNGFLPFYFEGISKVDLWVKSSQRFLLDTYKYNKQDFEVLFEHVNNKDILCLIL